MGPSVAAVNKERERENAKKMEKECDQTSQCNVVDCNNSATKTNATAP